MGGYGSGVGGASRGRPLVHKLEVSRQSTWRQRVALCHGVALEVGSEVSWCAALVVSSRSRGSLRRGGSLSMRWTKGTSGFTLSSDVSPWAVRAKLI